MLLKLPQHAQLHFSVPLLALVDGDPYGLDILSVYKYGSQSLKHENRRLTAERIEGLGLWTSDMREYEHRGIQFMYILILQGWASI